MTIFIFCNFIFKIRVECDEIVAENEDVQTVLQRRQALKNRVIGKVPDSNEVASNELALPDPEKSTDQKIQRPKSRALPKTQIQKMMQKPLYVAPVEVHFVT